MSKADKILEKVKEAKNESDEFWLTLYDDMMEVINGDYPKIEKDKLLNFGYAEMIVIMHDGIVNETKKN